jgi:hypothetical protein
MKKRKRDASCNNRVCKNDICKSGPIYALGMIGAAIYYIQTATGFWMGAFGLLKALLWPAFLIFDLLKFLGM